jgi:hypothetical protein
MSGTSREYVPLPYPSERLFILLEEKVRPRRHDVQVRRVSV